MNMEKEFGVWHRLKADIHASEREVLFPPQEVWWCSIGINVGVEADGKHSLFERPVIVFRKCSKEMFWALPLTTKIKSPSPYYFPFILNEVHQTALISQMRVLSSKRLIRRLAKLSDAEFTRLNVSVIEYIQKTDPVRGPQVPNGNNGASLATHGDLSTMRSAQDEEKAPREDGTSRSASP